MRRLTPAETDSYDVVDRGLAARVRVARVWMLTPGVDGMTLGRFVLLRRDDDRSGGRSLLAHELVHVRQWRELGVIGFCWVYFGDYLRGLIRLRSHRGAYLAIGLEVEAREEELAWADRRSRGDAGGVR